MSTYITGIGIIMIWEFDLIAKSQDDIFMA